MVEPWNQWVAFSGKYPKFLSVLIVGTTLYVRLFCLRSLLSLGKWGKLGKISLKIFPNRFSRLNSLSSGQEAGAKECFSLSGFYYCPTS